MIYEGFLAVKSILENPQREIETLYVQKDKFSKSINYCRALAHQRKIEIRLLEKEEFAALTTGFTHGGILVKAKALALLTQVPDHLGYWAFIEGVEDPYNLGAILRTLYCAGYDGMITPWRAYETMNPIVVKSSAGASEKLPWYGFKNLSASLMTMKVNGHHIIVSHRAAGSRNYTEIDFRSPHVLCIGGEKRGLSKQVLDLADIWCKIKYENRQAKVALSAVSATAILSFEKGRNYDPEI